MNKYFRFLIGTIFLTNIALAQQARHKQEGQYKHDGNFEQTKDGIISGTVLDSVSQKPLQSATIFIYNETRDSVTNSVKEMLAGNAVTKKDGKFEINNVPSPGRIRVQVSNIGYDIYNRSVSVSPRTKNQADLGHVLLQQTSGNLQTVNVTAAQPILQMGVDRKIFNVAQSLASTGQTAQEVLAQIPSVSVDIDGNVAVRGASPQIYVDGLPTMLTLDQIPSDLIDKVELITNPSAKFDASTGGGGILNIVLKKNSRTGYNGGVNAGSDTRGGWNVGGDINVSLGKFNVFARAAHRERRQNQTSRTTRNNLDSLGNETSTIDQKSNPNYKNTGGFTFLSLGTDYNLNKNNIFTISGNYVRGTFDNNQPQTIDSVFYNGHPNSYGNLLSASDAGFRNTEGELKYRHNFSDDGNHNILFDINYNSGRFHNTSNINTGTYSDPGFDAATLFADQKRYSSIVSNMHNFIFQADYVNPVTENSKIEAGIRGQISRDDPTSYQYQYNAASDIPDDMNIGLPQYLDTSASSQYSSKNQVYAAYGIFSSKIGEKLSYQAGGRIESSNYHGIYDSVPSGNPAPEFKVKYPVQFFPSAYLSYNLAEGEDLQVNYSRKVNRPNFFQLFPILNKTDPYNIQTGNPDLQPEFTSMYEVSYDKTYKNSGNFLASVYYRHSTNLITNYQYKQDDSTIINTYANAKGSEVYGLELDNNVTVAKIWTLGLNYNLFNSIIDADKNLGTAKNQRWAWFAKWNNSVKLPAGFTFQLTGQYYSKTVLPNSGGGGAQAQNGGGRGFGGGPIGSTQGYIDAHYQFDAALKKDWKWGKGNTLSLTASINDIFATDKNQSYSATPYMNQESYRMRQPRVARFTLSYRFGRMDKSLFKKGQPQQQNDNSGGDMGGMMGG